MHTTTGTDTPGLCAHPGPASLAQGQMQGAQGSLALIQQMWNKGLARLSDPAHDARPRRFDMYSEEKCTQHMLRAGDSKSLTRRMSQIQDDLENCAPQIATWPPRSPRGHRFNMYSEGKSDSQDESDSGRPRKLRAPDRHVATQIAMWPQI